MSALAEILLLQNKRVCGYDRCVNDYTRSLESLGVEVIYDISVDIGGYDCIVYTDAIPQTNRILCEAKRLDKPVISRGELLSCICGLFGYTIAVAGCHGKTTSTAMLAHIFSCAKEKFACHIGGSDQKFGNCAYFGKEYFITEACEYKRNFLKLKPNLGIILNSDVDHPDCYEGVEEVKEAYAAFGGNCQKLIRLYGDGKKGEIAITFGFDDRADYFAKNIKKFGGKYKFTAYERGNELGEVVLNVYGKHNVLNALAAICAARYCKIDFKEIAEGLNSFGGVKRRFEFIGEINGVQCIADYAHHPKELRAAIKAAHDVCRGTLYVVFQPHTYSRTKALFKDFIAALSLVKKLLIYKTFPAREYYDDAGSALTLSRGIKRAMYGDSPEDIIYFTTTAKKGDLILFLGAGDIYDIALDIIAGGRF